MPFAVERCIEKRDHGLMILTLFLTACGEDTTQLAKDEFSKYFNGKDEVVLNLDDNLYFENRILKEESLEPWVSYYTTVVYKKSIYYASFDVSRVGLLKERIDFINIYKCDLYGKNTTKIFSKELNTLKKVDAKAYKNVIYIQYA